VIVSNPDIKPRIESILSNILSKKYDSGVVLEKVERFKNVLSFDIEYIKSQGNTGGVSEDMLKFLSDIESDINEVFINLKKEQDLFASYIESKRNILLLKEYLNEFLSNDESLPSTLLLSTILYFSRKAEESLLSDENKSSKSIALFLERIELLIE